MKPQANFPKLAGGRKEQYTAAQVCDAVKAARGLVTLAALHLKCSRETVRKYINKYPACKAALEDARELQLDLCEYALFDAIAAREVWAIRWHLGIIGKSRGYVEKIETDVRLTQTKTYEGIDDAEVLGIFEGD